MKTTDKGKVAGIIISRLKKKVSKTDYMNFKTAFERARDTIREESDGRYNIIFNKTRAVIFRFDQETGKYVGMNWCEST